MELKGEGEREVKKREIKKASGDKRHRLLPTHNNRKTVLFLVRFKQLAHLKRLADVVLMRGKVEQKSLSTFTVELILLGMFYLPFAIAVTLLLFVYALGVVGAVIAVPLILYVAGQVLRHAFGEPACSRSG